MTEQRLKKDFDVALKKKKNFQHTNNGYLHQKNLSKIQGIGQFFT